MHILYLNTVFDNIVVELIKKQQYYLSITAPKIIRAMLPD